MSFAVTRRPGMMLVAATRTCRSGLATWIRRLSTSATNRIPLPSTQVLAEREACGITIAQVFNKAAVAYMLPSRNATMDTTLCVLIAPNAELGCVRRRMICKSKMIFSNNL